MYSHNNFQRNILRYIISSYKFLIEKDLQVFFSVQILLVGKKKLEFSNITYFYKLFTLLQSNIKHLSKPYLRYNWVWKFLKHQNCYFFEEKNFSLWNLKGVGLLRVFLFAEKSNKKKSNITKTYLCWVGVIQSYSKTYIY